jgi:uncharacterized membrane protein
MAVELNDTLYPIIEDVAGLMPHIVDLVIAIVPAIVTLMVVGFIAGFFDSIISRLKL